MCRLLSITQFCRINEYKKMCIVSSSIRHHRHINIVPAIWLSVDNSIFELLATLSCSLSSYTFMMMISVLSFAVVATCCSNSISKSLKWVKKKTRIKTKLCNSAIAVIAIVVFVVIHFLFCNNKLVFYLSICIIIKGSS